MSNTPRPMREAAIQLVDMLAELDAQFLAIRSKLAELKLTDQNISDGLSEAFNLVWTEESSSVEYDALNRHYLTLRSTMELALNHAGLMPNEASVETGVPSSAQSPMASDAAFHETKERLTNKLRLMYSENWQVKFDLSTAESIEADKARRAEYEDSLRAEEAAKEQEEMSSREQ